SDPLLIAAGDAPFAAAVILMWRARRHQVERPRLLATTGAGAGAAFVAAGMLLADRLGGYGSSFPRGLNQVVPPEHFMGNLRLVVNGVVEVAAMPSSGSVLGVVLGLLLVAGVCLPLGWLIASVRGPMPASQLSVVAFWSGSALFVAAA